LEARIRNNPYSAEDDLAKYRKEIELERERKEIENEAMKLKNEAMTKVEEIQMKGWSLPKGSAQSWLKVKERMKARSFENAIGELESLLEKLNEEFTRKEKETQNKRDELIARLSELSSNDFGIWAPPELEEKIKNDPYGAEDDVESFSRSIDLEIKRRKTKEKALLMKDEAMKRVSQIKSNGDSLPKGTAQAWETIKKSMKEGQFEKAIEELGSLLSRLGG